MVRSIVLSFIAMFFICSCENDVGSGEGSYPETNPLQLSSEAQKTTVKMEGDRTWVFWFEAIKKEPNTIYTNDSIIGDWYKMYREKNGRNINIEVEKNTTNTQRATEIDIFNGHSAILTFRVEQAAGN